jgi:hypothetical protein
MPFRVPNILGEFKGKICSECISYNLEFQNFLGEDARTPHLPGSPPLCAARFVPLALNSIQTNFPGNFHDKISLRISLQQEELKNVVIYNYK